MEKLEKIIGGIVGGITILAVLYLVFSSYFKITSLEDDAKNTRLELGQFRSKLIESNQTAIDFILKSSLSNEDKAMLKKRYDKINSDWLQYMDGGKIHGKAFQDDNYELVN